MRCGDLYNTSTQFLYLLRRSVCYRRTIQILYKIGQRARSAHGIYSWEGRSRMRTLGVCLFLPWPSVPHRPGLPRGLWDRWDQAQYNRLWQAVAAAQAGDTITIASGEYDHGGSGTTDRKRSGHLEPDRVLLRHYPQQPDDYRRRRHPPDHERLRQGLVPARRSGGSWPPGWSSATSSFQLRRLEQCRSQRCWHLHGLCPSGASQSTIACSMIASWACEAGPPAACRIRNGSYVERLHLWPDDGDSSGTPGYGYTHNIYVSG